MRSARTTSGGSSGGALTPAVCQTEFGDRVCPVLETAGGNSWERITPATYHFAVYVTGGSDDVRDVPGDLDRRPGPASAGSLRGATAPAAPQGALGRPADHRPSLEPQGGRRQPLNRHGPAWWPRRTGVRMSA